MGRRPPGLRKMLIFSYLIFPKQPAFCHSHGGLEASAPLAAQFASVPSFVKKTPLFIKKKPHKFPNPQK